MAPSAPIARTLARLASLPAIVAWGFALRVAAALAVQHRADGVGKLCLFADTDIYWQLGQALRSGAPYVVSQWGVPHYALRTPGYPMFLAACQAIFGDHIFPVRVVQAALGAGCAWLLARLVEAVWPDSRGEGWTAPKVAALWAASDPFVVGTSVLLLSEAVFVPLMLAMLWGMARLWSEEGARFRPALALGTGATGGWAILVKPSWALFVPVVLLAWAAAERGRRWVVFRAMVVALGVALAMGPWWARNARVFGRFVPTAIWVGASLYDGLSPTATGASDMSFLADRTVRVHDETTQDAALLGMAVDFADKHPRRTIELAAVKAARFWSPWPNAESLRSPIVAVLSALVTIPFYVCLVIGAWDRRRDFRARTLLLGPLLTFAALHMVFVSSIRYRIPVAVPAMGMAAMGLRKVLSRAERA